MTTLTQSRTLPTTWTVVLAFAAIYLIWGSTYLAALIGLESLPPFLMASLRFLSAGGLLYSWCLFRREQAVTRLAFSRNAIAGVLMLGGGTGSVIWAEQYLPTGLAAILVTTLPLWFVVLDRPQWASYRTAKLRLVGLLLGFSGILLLFSEDPAALVAPAKAAMYWPSIAVILVGTISWAVGSLYSRYRKAPGSTILNAAVQLLAAGLFCLFVSAGLGEWTGFTITQVTVRSWVALTYAVIFGSVVAYLSYLWLLQVRPPAVVGTYAYVNPVVAVLLGWALANETITSRQLTSLAIILVGVLLVNRSSSR
ncbi:EamA family transporter [Spirosoma oryzicola]|uniref:EamA family transporter n=1 Tax=Spirosoma oryzicola TaxID=2898794 RepID=UPI001E3CAE38|nr:EamA family transporter [Spirosoma oryzicola]UHG90531.1 EamA family transporter [Spirosoma oryzicola]